MNGSPRASDDEGTYPRLQGRLQDQLAFVNNLLTTLSVAVLAFAAGAVGDPAKLHELGWRRGLFGAALLLLAASLLVGIGLAVNRLQSFRITAQIARIRELHDDLDLDWRDTDSVKVRLWRRSEFIATWSGFGLKPPDGSSRDSWTRRTVRKLTGKAKRRKLEDPATLLAARLRPEETAERQPQSVTAPLRFSSESAAGFLAESPVTANVQEPSAGNVVPSPTGNEAAAPTTDQDDPTAQSDSSSPTDDLAEQLLQSVCQWVRGAARLLTDTAAGDTAAPQTGNAGNPLNADAAGPQPTVGAGNPAAAGNPQPSIDDLATQLLEKLREWGRGADGVTWRLLWWQALTFVLAALVLLIVPISYYF